MHCYALLLARYPYIVIGIVFVLATICIIVPFKTRPLPKFEDPDVGFEPRGTTLAQRIRAWNNLVSHSRDILSLLPYQNVTFPNPVNNDSHGTHSNMTSLIHSDMDIAETENINYTPLESPPFFCGIPHKDYALAVFKHVDGSNLFTAAAIKSMCQVEEHKIRSQDRFCQLCDNNTANVCCRSWNIGNYIAFLSNKTSCYLIVESDVQKVRDRLSFCAEYYHKGLLLAECGDEPYLCPDVPQQCTEHNAIYIIFHYLLDYRFLNPTMLNNDTLTYAIVFLPVARSKYILELYHAIEEESLTDGLTEIVAMDFGIRFYLFEEYLLKDTVFIGIAMGAIFLLMWGYTRSFFITVMTLFAVIFSLGIAYFLYTFIFNLRFFPFMNLLTCIIVIGIGADDVFIYVKVWASVKSEKNNGTLEKLIYDTLYHASLSMFVTSLTTASAFFANYINNITAIRCFSVYTGTAILTNFFLMVTWLPACIIIADKWCSHCCHCCMHDVYLGNRSICFRTCGIICRIHYRFCDWMRVFFEKILPCVVIKFRIIWIVLFGGLAVGGAIAIFYHPKLKLPTSSKFQLFSPDHIFEIYELKFKDLFWFEKTPVESSIIQMPLRIVWGIHPTDNGDYLNPHDKGVLQLDESFDITAPASQKWLLKFCTDLKNQNFYQPIAEILSTNCFIEPFKLWMEKSCENLDETDERPCCEESTFPFKKKIFSQCVSKYIKALYSSSHVHVSSSNPGPRFDKNNNRIKALVVEYISKYSFTLSYNDMHDLFITVESWISKQMKQAPKGMKNGWFTSFLDIYDLQDTLSRGTLISMGVSVGITFAVLLFTTLNILVSIYAIFTIAGVIFATIGSLVLLGWNLNILESTTISIAVGLAVDFTLHYGVAYRLSHDSDRESRVVYSIAYVGSPVTMAALTTFLAGIFMLPSSVLPYLQIGTFIILVMTFSWAYATFFFQSVLRIIGPQGDFGQFHWPNLRICHLSIPRVDKTVYTMSESTLSTSSANNPNHSGLNEIHELEPLTNIKCKNKLKNKNPRTLTFRRESMPVQTSSIYKPNRKISLPTGNLPCHTRHVSMASSSTTIIYIDDEHEPAIIPNRQSDIHDVWIKRI